MQEFEDHRVGVLSGGQRRRLALAIELTSRPEILLCDEVTSGLDPQSEDDIVKLLHALSRQSQRLVLSVTHSLMHLELYDSVTVFYKGALINGKVFDQTKPEEPAQFQSGALIPGWVEALKLMKTGDTWEIVVPSDLGYGSDGAGDSIPPDQTLVFTMSLTKDEYAP